VSGRERGRESESESESGREGESGIFCAVEEFKSPTQPINLKHFIFSLSQEKNKKNKNTYFVLQVIVCVCVCVCVFFSHFFNFITTTNKYTFRR